ncbi:unnamed protein product [Nippostrongylus brasiliensis]|uniref:Uncharacterized protein n=1 Tax=Nippostrongylus brasiliensis TaxID=27835 RepID=A0A0N4YQU1_NIPBR|nr:unnamed protein product [Nippostrongylus brasiliensis]
MRQLIAAAYEFDFHVTVEKCEFLSKGESQFKVAVNWMDEEVCLRWRVIWPRSESLTDGEETTTAPPLEPCGASE